MYQVVNLTSELLTGSNQLTSRSQIGDVKHSDLPGMEALGREGKKDGQVIMIKNKGVVEAYSVSGTETLKTCAHRAVDGCNKHLAASRYGCRCYWTGPQAAVRGERIRLCVRRGRFGGYATPQTAIQRLWYVPTNRTSKESLIGRESMDRSAEILGEPRTSDIIHRTSRQLYREEHGRGNIGTRRFYVLRRPLHWRVQVYWQQFGSWSKLWWWRSLHRSVGLADS